MVKTNYMMVLQYDGSRYDGWQRQTSTDKTIQGKVEQVLSRLAGEPVEVHGSGRTDAGVHALGQAANFYMEGRRRPEEILEYLNQYLPEDICVLSVKIVPDRFHCRLWAKRKTYCYRICTGSKKDVFQRKYIYGLGTKLDVEKMKAAAEYLIGTHDFKSFCGNRKMKKSTVRTIEQICFQEEGDVLEIRYTGNGFLQNMVRILTGTLIEVGQGKRRPEEMTAILDMQERQAAGFTAPAEGLFLEYVEY